MAVDSSGEVVYVSDNNGNCIKKFTYDSGDYVYSATIGSSGTDPGQFDGPWGLAVDDGGNLYVADTANNRIQKFDGSGDFVATWGTGGTGNGEFWSPTGVDVDSDGNIYVADKDNSRIQELNSSGTFVTKWGSGPSDGDGEFNSPWALDVDAYGNVYVADTYNNRVQEFDSDGNFLTTWGSYGYGDGEFYGPSGVAVHPNGKIYVADSGSNRIEVFAPEPWMTFLGSTGYETGYGIAVDDDGYTYVIGTTPSAWAEEPGARVPGRRRRRLRGQALP